MARPATKRSRASRDEAGEASVAGLRGHGGESGKATNRPPRTQAAEARRAAILAAALDEFTARGYEGARLDDVAKRAGIAKGTIYLYFADKETLFQELVRSMVHPVLGMLDKMRGVEIPARMLVEGLLGTFVREVYRTRRKDLIRLILNEGPRFPAIAEFYYHEVIERVLLIIRPILARAAERRELPNDSLARFPQLIVAPMLVGIMWHAMFDKFEPLDIDAMVRAHIDILFGGRGR